MLRLAFFLIFASISFTYGLTLFPTTRLAKDITGDAEQIDVSSSPITFYGGFYTTLKIFKLQGVVVFQLPGDPLEMPKYKSFPNPDYPKNDNDYDESDLPLVAAFYEPDISQRFGSAKYLHLKSENEIEENEVYKALAQTMVSENFNTPHPTSMLLVSWQNEEQCATRPCQKNIFQMALGWSNFTDTYVVLNYENVTLVTQNSKVGFNAGNGLGWTDAVKNTVDNLKELNETYGSATQGRYVYKIDGLPKRGGCYGDNGGGITINQTQLSYLGGDVIALRGPCLNISSTVKFTCEFKKENFRETTNAKINHLSNASSYLTCPSPKLSPVGDITVLLKGGQNDYEAKLYASSTFKPQVQINKAENLYQSTSSNQRSFEINWERQKINSQKAQVQVFGYDDTAQVSLNLLAEKEVDNTGTLQFSSNSISCKNNNLCSKYWFGVISVSEPGEDDSKILWTSIIPLNWLQKNTDLAEKACNEWVQNERKKKISWSVQCPCTLDQISADFASFKKLDKCTLLPNGDCAANQKCYTSTFTNSASQSATCCYNADSFLQFFEYQDKSTESIYSSFTTATTSNDMEFSFWKTEGVNRFLCCKWNQDPKLCSDYLEVRPRPTCSNYKPPKLAIAVGDPHFVTFDWDTYFTFNGFGEFILMETSDTAISIQGRFEEVKQITENEGNKVTAISAIAIKLYDSKYEIAVAPKAYSLNKHYFLLRKDGILHCPSNGIQDEKITITTDKTDDPDQLNSTRVLVNVKLRNDRFIGLIISAYKKQYMDVMVSMNDNMKYETYGLWGHLSENNQSSLILRDKSSVAQIQNQDNDEEVYNEFGTKWALANVHESAFSYYLKVNFELFNKQTSFKPQFAEREQEGVERDPPLTKFDNFDTDWSYPEMAFATHDKLKEFENFQQSATTVDTFCGRPDIPNAIFSNNNYNENNTLNVVSCVEKSYTMKLTTSQTTMTCTRKNNIASWVPDPVNNLCLYVQPKKSVNMAAIIVPVVVVVLIILIVIVVFTVLRLKNRKRPPSRAGSSRGKERTSKPIVKSDSAPEYFEGKANTSEAKPMKYDVKREELHDESDDDGDVQPVSKGRTKPPKPTVASNETRQSGPSLHPYRETRQEEEV